MTLLFDDVTVKTIYNTRNHAILFSKKKAKKPFSMEKKNLQQVYEEATKKFEQDPSDSNLINTLNEAKEILESYYEEKTRGVIIRARALWHEHGERSTNYFLNLENRNHVKKTYKKTANKCLVPFHLILLGY